MPRASDFSRANIVLFQLVEINRIGGKFLSGCSVGCTFYARTEHSVRLFLHVEPDRDANPQQRGSSVPCSDGTIHEQSA